MLRAACVRKTELSLRSTESEQHPAELCSLACHQLSTLRLPGLVAGIQITEGSTAQRAEANSKYAIQNTQ